MYKCLRISFDATAHNASVMQTIQQIAKRHDLEGFVQSVVSEKKIMIIACGNSEALDSFLDTLYHDLNKEPIGYIHVEPFLNDKDYRGVFRILE
jgi:acylphosphatase